MGSAMGEYCEYYRSQNIIEIKECSFMMMEMVVLSPLSSG